MQTFPGKHDCGRLPTAPQHGCPVAPHGARVAASPTSAVTTGLSVGGVCTSVPGGTSVGVTITSIGVAGVSPCDVASVPGRPESVPGVIAVQRAPVASTTHCSDAPHAGLHADTHAPPTHVYPVRHAGVHVEPFVG